MRACLVQALVAVTMLVVPVSVRPADCPNCVYDSVPNYGEARVYKVNIVHVGQRTDRKYKFLCEREVGDVEDNPRVYVPEGSFVAWKLAVDAADEYVVVELTGRGIFEGDVRSIVVYRGQWSWARVASGKALEYVNCRSRPASHKDPFCLRGQCDTPGPGVIVCPPPPQPCP